MPKKKKSLTAVSRTFFREIPMTETTAHKFAKSMIDWVEANEEALAFGEFLTVVGLRLSTVRDYCRRFAVVEEAYEYTLQVLATRRELGALKRALDARIFLALHAMYDKEYKKLEEWRASLKNKENENALSKDDVKGILEDILRPVDEEDED